MEFDHADENMSQASGSTNTVDMDGLLDEALAEINRKLRKNKAKIFPVLQIVRSADSSLSTGLKRKGSGDQIGNARKPFATSYNKLVSLASDFMVECIFELANGKFTKNDRDVLERLSKQSVRDLFWMCTQTPSGLKQQRILR